MEHEEVLELIGSASQRYDTVRAALRYRADGPTLKEIRERIARTESGRRAFGISPREAAERLKCPIDHPEPDGPFGWSCRAWHADTSEEASQAEAIRSHQTAMAGPRTHPDCGLIPPYYGDPGLRSLGC